jgi:putative hydrolase of the HAD superfamily
MVSAVIFDFYGTLAHWADVEATDYAAVFAAHGYVLAPEALDTYFQRYDGVDHAEHSVSEAAYEAWVRTRLRDLTDACCVADGHVDGVIDALRSSDQGEMVAYPEAAAVLSSLRDAGLAIGVCSNWGWELDAFLDAAGLLHLVDAAVTSARAGARKPHPAIYAQSVAALGVAAADVLFVGDSWEPDVRGPRRAGMAAAHVWRRDERGGQRAPVLRPGDHRVGGLGEVPGVLEALDGTASSRPPERGRPGL